jgi:hypothetical protein
MPREITASKPFGMPARAVLTCGTGCIKCAVTRVPALSAR